MLSWIFVIGVFVLLLAMIVILSISSAGSDVASIIITTLGWLVLCSFLIGASWYEKNINIFSDIEILTKSIEQSEELMSNDRLIMSDTNAKQEIIKMIRERNEKIAYAKNVNKSPFSFFKIDLKKLESVL